jgi:Rieske Fe-S protein
MTAVAKSRYSFDQGLGKRPKRFLMRTASVEYDAMSVTCTHLPCRVILESQCSFGSGSIRLRWI